MKLKLYQISFCLLYAFASFSLSLYTKYVLKYKNIPNRSIVRISFSLFFLLFYFKLSISENIANIIFPIFFVVNIFKLRRNFLSNLKKIFPLAIFDLLNHYLIFQSYRYLDINSILSIRKTLLFFNLLLDLILNSNRKNDKIINKTCIYVSIGALFSCVELNIYRNNIYSLNK